MNEIRQKLDSLAMQLTIAQFEKRPDMAARYGSGGRGRCLEDARFHLVFLAAAAEIESETLFLDYIAWTKTVLVSRRIAANDLRDNLLLLAEVIEREVPSAAGVAVRMIKNAAANLDAMPDDVPTFIDTSSAAGNLAQVYLEKLLQNDMPGAIAVIADVLARTPLIATEVLRIAQQEVGRLWQLNEITVATEHYCSGVTQQLVAQLTPRRASFADEKRRIVTMCAPGELHDIGIRIVSEVLQLQQWQVMQLGPNVPSRPAVEFCVSRKPDVLVISATLIPHVAGIAEVIELARERRELDGTRIIAGGRAFARHPEIVQYTGADGYAETPEALVQLLRAM